MLNHELLNKGADIVPEEDPLIILDRKSDVCMAKNGKDNKHTSHMARRVYFVRNGDNAKIHNIDWCERGLQLGDTATDYAGENDRKPRIKYIMVMIHN